MEKLGTYELTGHLTSQNSGYSIWGFGRKNGKNYFVKQFLSPKYPENDTVSSPERLQKKIAQCEKFEQRKIDIYRALNQNSDGNAVRVEEFFRIESKYYISMRKIEALPWTVEDVVALGFEEVKRICALIAHGIASIHKGRIIHADLKHDNVLFMKTLDGGVTAKIIDFDSSFLETDPPGENEEIIGDLVYFSPEACIRLWGDTPVLSCKMDVFSLGVLFHQYLTGNLPAFNRDECNYPGEAVAKGEILGVSNDLPTVLRELIVKMLDPDPNVRPTAIEAYEIFAKECGMIGEKKAEPVVAKPIVESAIKTHPIAPEVKPNEEDTKKSGGNPFFRPGKL